MIIMNFRKEEGICGNLKKKKGFTIKGYVVTVTNSSKKELKINILKKNLFDKAVKKVARNFIDQKSIEAYRNNTQEEIKTESKETTKEKVLEKDYVQTTNEQQTNLRELKSLKDYLLSKDATTQLQQTGIKVMQKTYEPKKAVGGTK